MEETKAFEGYLARQREAVWRVIAQCLDEYKAADADVLRWMGQEDYLPLLDDHWAVVDDYPRRQGKYLRPTLVMLGYQSLVTPATALPQDAETITAAAMQVSEDWILIHDDLCDGSLERRGRPALHREVGLEIAVNAGDTLHEVMHRILSRNLDVLPLDVARRVQGEFFRMLSRTTFGQYAEILWTQQDRLDMSEEDVLFTISGKTAYYTIAGPLRLGAILAGATDQQLESLYRFSYPLGVCFQIRDDILDLTSDFEGQKKQTCNDLYEGKRTLMLLHLLRHASPSQLQRIEAILAKPRQDKTAEDVSYLRSLMDEHGSIRYAADMAERYADEALRQLPTLQFVSEAFRPLFRQMVAFILQRGK
jgi:geranylgeranyl diphosphate synthase type II